MYSESSLGFSFEDYMKNNQRFCASAFLTQTKLFMILQVR